MDNPISITFRSSEACSLWCNWRFCQLRAALLNARTDGIYDHENVRKLLDAGIDDTRLDREVYALMLASVGFPNPRSAALELTRYARTVEFLVSVGLIEAEF